MSTNISVGIPIGPEPRHIRYLKECLDSVYNQTVRPDGIVLINDMNAIDHAELMRLVDYKSPNRVPYMYMAPWKLGIAHAFNFCVAKSISDFVIMLGADDTLEPDTIEQCLDAIDRVENPDMTYYWFGVKYSDGREDQYVPCNGAMVSKNLWKVTGGFPTESAVGAPDTMYISTFGYGRKFPKLVKFECVNKDRPLYNYRVRKNSDTNKKVGTWQVPIMHARDILTDTYELPTWGRYE